MRKMFLLFLLTIGLTTFGQRSDGFFISEYCFIDPVLLKTSRVDRIEIKLFGQNRKLGKIEMFLDSNQRLIEQITYDADSIKSTKYNSTNLTQFACPIERPDYIKNCEFERITMTESRGAYRITTFDNDGKVTLDRWKPGTKLLEIKRQFFYNSNNLLDSIKLEDITKDNKIDKKELYIYKYENEKLVSITQLINSSVGYQNAGLFKYKEFKCGLVKKMEATSYFGQYTAKVEFKYYSKENLLK